MIRPGWLFVFSLLVSVSSAAAESPSPVVEIANRLNAAARREPVYLAIDTRLRAAGMLRHLRPELALQFALAAARDATESGDTSYRIYEITDILLQLDLETAARATPGFAEPSWVYNAMVRHWLEEGDLDKAAAAAREGLRRGVIFGEGVRLLDRLKTKDPETASSLFTDLLEHFPERPTPSQLTFLLGAVQAICSADPPAAVRAAHWMLEAVVEGRLAQTGDVAVARYDIAGESIATATNEDFVLLPAGALLWVLDRDAYLANQAQFAPWDGAIRRLRREDLPSAIRARRFSIAPPDLAAKIASGAPPEPRRPRQEPAYLTMPFDQALRSIDELGFQRNAPRWLRLLQRDDLTAEQQQTLARLVLDELPRWPHPMRLNLAERTVRLAQSKKASWLPGALNVLLLTIRDIDGCRERICERLRERDVPRIYRSLAEAIHRGELEAEAADPSLQARLLLLDLQDALARELDFELPSQDGDRYRLRDLRGRPVVLYFWATWCVPCRKDLPVLEKLHRDQGETQPVILGLSPEEPGKIRSFYKNRELSFPTLYDQDRRVHDTFGVSGIPVTVVLDAEGNVAGRITGSFKADRLLRLLEKARPQPAAAPSTPQLN